MLLNSIALNNFRNHSKLDIQFPVVLYISGNNGTGKTSLIESIYLVLTTKTFRALPQDIKSFDQEFLRVYATFADSTRYEDFLFFYDSKRKLMINGSIEIDLKQYIYEMPVICYSPDYETVLSDEHSQRRAFLDRMIFYSDINYLDTVRSYNSLLKRKRAELTSEKPNRQVIEILTDEMIKYSIPITNLRRKLINEINTKIADNKDNLLGDIRLSLSGSELSLNKVADEITAGRPLCGCHKDLVYLKNGIKIIEKFQSFGQRKSILLSLLYYTSQVLREQRKDSVMLLLDDFEAGMDKNRISLLTERFFIDNKNQIVMTGISNNFSIDEINLNE